MAGRWREVSEGVIGPQTDNRLNKNVQQPPTDLSPPFLAESYPIFVHWLERSAKNSFLFGHVYCLHSVACKIAFVDSIDMKLN